MFPIPPIIRLAWYSCSTLDTQLSTQHTAHSTQEQSKRRKEDEREERSEQTWLPTWESWFLLSFVRACSEFSPLYSEHCTGIALCQHHFETILKKKNRAREDSSPNPPTPWPSMKHVALLLLPGTHRQFSNFQRTTKGQFFVIPAPTKRQFRDNLRAGVREREREWVSEWVSEWVRETTECVTMSSACAVAPAYSCTL